MVSPCQQRGTSLAVAMAPSNPLNRNTLTKISARKNVGPLREMYRGPRVMRLQAAAGESIREEASHRGTDLDGKNLFYGLFFDVMEKEEWLHCALLPGWRLKKATRADMTTEVNGVGIWIGGKD